MDILFVIIVAVLFWFAAGFSIYLWIIITSRSWASPKIILRGPLLLITYVKIIIEGIRHG